MKVWLRRIPLIAIGVLLLGLLVWAFLPAPAPVDLATVARGPLRVTVNEDGKTRIKERYTVSAPLTGQMMRIPLEPGDAVITNQTLIALIEPTDPALLDVRAKSEAEARVEVAEARRKRSEVDLARAKEMDLHAKKEYERIRQARHSGGASPQDMDSATMRERTAYEELRAAHFALQMAEFELKLAKAALTRTRPGSPGENDNGRFEIRSPISGKVLKVIQKSATVVTPGLQLIELGDPADLDIEVDVLSADAVKVKAGANVIIEHWGGDKPLHGRVRLVEPAAFTKTSALGVEEQRVNVMVDLLDPPEARPTLFDAFRVEARIVVWEKDDVLKVPASALFRHKGDRAVFLVKNGRAVVQKVEIGQNNGIEAEVLGGLQAGDRVVIHPSDKIHDGSSIAAR